MPGLGVAFVTTKERDLMSAGAPSLRAAQILGITLALTNLLLWFCVPAIRAFVDERTGRWADPNNPMILIGVQELLVYFDPWLARGVFPVVYTLGLAVIPFLVKASRKQTGARSGHIAVTLILVGFEAVWLFLIVVAVFLRGPNWNIFWPGEEWDPHRVMTLNRINLSEYFWVSWMGQPVENMSWLSREFPGLALISAYFLAGPVIAFCLFRSPGNTTHYWRLVLLVLLLQLAAIVPIKMLLCWLFNLKYLIFIPEYFINV
jgi:hypothetical protein